MTFLSYNCQRGHLGRDFLESLTQMTVDFFCFQRFPQEFVDMIPYPNKIYHPSFHGAESGILLATHLSCDLSSENSSTKRYTDPSQCTAFASARCVGFDVITTVPPYLSDEAPPTDETQHIDYLLKKIKQPTVIIGDMHHDDRFINKTPLNGFRNHAQKSNFLGRNSESLCLTKCLTNFTLTHFSEKVIETPSTPVTHSPVIFELLWD